MNALILSVSAGGGHKHAAQAIAEYTEKAEPGSQVLVIDTLKYISPILDKVLIGTYLNTLKYYPRAFKFMYSASDVDRTNLLSILHRIDDLVTARLLPLIEESRPNILIATHPFTSHMLSALRNRYGLTIPNLSIMTDYGSHAAWTHSGVDRYVVAHESMIPEITIHGRAWDTILPLGIPLKESFLAPTDQAATYAELGFDPQKPTLTLVGGSLGMGNLAALFQVLLDLPRDFNLLFIAGSNRKLYGEAKDMARGATKPVAVLAYSSKMNALMQITDLLITKPGGLTVTEAINSGTPMAIFNAIPGQEEQNARFLIRHGLAVDLMKGADPGAVLMDLLDQPDQLVAMRQVMKAMAKPHSTRDIYALIQDLVANPPKIQKEINPRLKGPDLSMDALKNLADDIRRRIQSSDVFCQLNDFIRGASFEDNRADNPPPLEELLKAQELQQDNYSSTEEK